MNNLKTEGGLSGLGSWFFGCDASYVMRCWSHAAPISYVRLLLTKPTKNLSRPTRQGKRGWNHQMILKVTVKRSTGV